MGQPIVNPVMMNPFLMLRSLYPMEDAFFHQQFVDNQDNQMSRRRKKKAKKNAQRNQPIPQRNQPIQQRNQPTPQRNEPTPQRNQPTPQRIPPNKSGQAKKQNPAPRRGPKVQPASKMPKAPQTVKTLQKVRGPSPEPMVLVDTSGEDLIAVQQLNDLAKEKALVPHFIFLDPSDMEFRYAQKDLVNAPRGTYTCELVVADKQFFGKAETALRAQAQAATSAINIIKMLPDKSNAFHF